MHIEFMQSGGSLCSGQLPGTYLIIKLIRQEHQNRNNIFSLKKKFNKLYMSDSFHDCQFAFRVCVILCFGFTILLFLCFVK